MTSVLNSKNYYDFHHIPLHERRSTAKGDPHARISLFLLLLTQEGYELDQVESLTEDELDRLIAETKVTSKDRDTPRLRKTIAAYFYEYAMRKALKREKE